MAGAGPGPGCQKEMKGVGTISVVFKLYCHFSTQGSSASFPAGPCEAQTFTKSPDREVTQKVNLCHRS